MSSLVSKNIFWLTVSRTAALVLLFLAYAALFRYLGPEEYGRYQFALSFVMLFSTVVDFGIQQFVTKKISEQPESKQKYFQSFLAFELLIALLLFLALTTIAYFSHFDRTLMIAVTIMGLGLVANALAFPFLAVMTAFQDLRKVALINFINSFVNISIIFLAIWFKQGIIFLAGIQIIFGVLDLILYRFFIKKHLPEPQVLRGFAKLDINLIKNILFSAWPFVLLVGFSAIYNRIDVIIITKLQGFEQTGYYGAAYKIFDILAFFPAVVSHSLFPHLTALMAKQAITEVRANLEKYLKLMIAVALPMAVGGSILSKKLIMLLAGEQYLAAAPVLAILIWAPALLFIYIPINSLVISQLTKKAAAVTGVNVLINILGNILLIPIFGIKAAAAMTVVSESLQGIFYFYFVKKNITDFNFVSIFLKPAIAAAVMGIVLWYIRDMNLLISLSAGAVVYTLMLLISGFVGKDDLRFLRGVFHSADS